MSDPIVGIDLGTSNSVVAHADTLGNVKVLGDEAGFKIHPSVVSFHPNGGVVVGASAKQRKVIDPQNTIYSAKRLIGRGFSAPEVQIARTRVPYPIKEGPNALPLIVTRAGEFAVPEISAIVLDHVRNIAAAQLATTVSRAVVTVPASFNDAQRSATATAGAIAGLTVVRVLNEPTAAALAYGNSRDLKATIAVYDFGGGTFDITILKLHDQVYEVLGTAGDTFLGGDDLDERLVDKMVAKFLAENRLDLRTNEVSMMRLRAVAEQTKIELSRRSRAVVRVDEIAYGPGGKPLNLAIEITREELVSQVADIIDKTFPVCKEALGYAGLGIDGIDDVILVGGTTKIPYVRDQVSKFFSKAPRTDVNPEEAVAAGAALQATSLERILTRSASQRHVVPVRTVHEDIDDPPTQDTSLTDVVVAPSPARTQTQDRPQTEYSLPRTGAREVFEERTPVPQGSSAVPAPAAGAIGRLRPTGAARAPQRKTPAPTPRPPPTPRRPPATEPEFGGNTEDVETKDWGERDDFRTAPGDQFLSHVAPVPEPSPMASLPTVVMTPHDLDEPSPSSTVKGFAPPQTYPVIQPRAMPVVMDVTPRSLGIATVAGFCEELIRRNSRLPAEMVKMFTTSRDLQNAVRIVVCQGESRRLDNNVVIGDLRLEGLPARPRGETSIEVTFSLDASGILQVRARDGQTGREQRASLDLVGGVREQDVSAARDRIQQLRR